MQQMRFEAPETLDAAVGLLASADGEARVLAGGTDLLVQLRAEMIEPALVVDIKRIPEMLAITKESDGGFKIGAAVPCQALGENIALKAAWPGVVEGAELIGSTDPLKTWGTKSLHRGRTLRGFRPSRRQVRRSRQRARRGGGQRQCEQR